MVKGSQLSVICCQTHMRELEMKNKNVAVTGLAFGVALLLGPTEANASTPGAGSLFNGVEIVRASKTGKRMRVKGRRDLSEIAAALVTGRYSPTCG